MNIEEEPTNKEDHILNVSHTEGHENLLISPGDKHGTSPREDVNIEEEPTIKEDHILNVSHTVIKTF